MKDEEEKQRDEKKVHAIFDALDALAKELNEKSILTDSSTIQRIDEVIRHKVICHLFH